MRSEVFFCQALAIADRIVKLAMTTLEVCVKQCVGMYTLWTRELEVAAMWSQ